MSEAFWKTTVTELMGIFKSSLLKLIPIMEKAHLTWKEGEAYDQWDEIVQSLFKGIVVSALEWGINKDYTNIQVPKYGFIYPEYSRFSFIEIINKDQEEGSHLLFHSFGTQKKPLDSTYCVKINTKGEILTNDLILIVEKDVLFIFQHRKSLKELVPVSELNIQEIWE